MIPDQDQLRQLPSVNELLQAPASRHLIIQFSHDLVVYAIRTSLAQARTDILTGASPALLRLVCWPRLRISSTRNNNLTCILSLTQQE